MQRTNVSGLFGKFQVVKPGKRKAGEALPPFDEQAFKKHLSDLNAKLFPKTPIIIPRIPSSTSMSSITSESSEISTLKETNGKNIFACTHNDNNKLEVENVATGTKWLASNHSQPFYITGTWHATSQRTAIELGVSGGMLYRTYLGTQQPSYHLAEATIDDDEKVYYRLSEKVIFDAEGDAIFKANKPCNGFFNSLIVSLFFGDSDIGNIFVKDGQIIRFDPEFCFSDYCRSKNNEYDAIEKEINYLFNFNEAYLKQVQSLATTVKTPNNIPPFLTECFSHTLFSLPNVQQLLLNHEKRKQEILSALAKIYLTPFDVIKATLTQYISDTNVRNSVEAEFQKRLAHFKQVSLNLPGFKANLESIQRTEAPQIPQDEKKEEKHSASLGFRG